MTLFQEAGVPGTPSMLARVSSGINPTTRYVVNRIFAAIGTFLFVIVFLSSRGIFDLVPHYLLVLAPLPPSPPPPHTHTTHTCILQL